MRRATGSNGSDTITILFSPEGARENWRFNRHHERLSRRLCAKHPSQAPIVYMGMDVGMEIYQRPRQIGRSFVDEMLNAIRDNCTMEVTPTDLKLKNLRPAKPWYRHKERW